MAIDDTSQMLGELISSVRTLNKSTNDIWEKLDEMEKTLAKVSANERAIAEMKPHVDEFRILKQRGLGVLGMIGLIASSAGAGAVYLMEKLMGGGS